MDGVWRELTDVGVSHDSEFRDLVQQIMNAGWYRTGQVQTPSGVQWGFREGHILEADAGNERWIPARAETEAMRILLNTVRNERVAEES